MLLASVDEICILVHAEKYDGVEWASLKIKNLKLGE